MSDKKISALASSSTPLSGTEELPIVQSGATKKVTIDSLTDGKIVPALRFHASAGSSGQTANGNADEVVIEGSSKVGLSILTPSSTQGLIFFGDENSANVGRISYDHVTDSLTITTQSTHNCTFTSSGNLAFASGSGIDFSATSDAAGMTSELLDDYEEGTWTATAKCTGNSTTSATVTGYYTKVGRKVTVGFRLLNNIDTTGMSGFFLVSLPFVCMSGATAAFCGSCAFADLTIPSGGNAVFPITENGSSNALFRVVGDGYGGGLLAASQLTSGATDISYFGLTYFTA